MRHPSLPSIKTLATLLAAGFASLAPAGAGGDALPMRKEGLWQLTTTMDEGAGPREQTFKMCISASTEQQTVQTSLVEHKQNCATYEIKQVGGATTVDADCTYSGSSVRSHTEMSGDFKQAFDVKIESTTAQTGGNQSRSVKRTIKQTGSYLGESCGDLAPGEAMGADGKKVAVQ